MNKCINCKFYHECYFMTREKFIENQKNNNCKNFEREEKNESFNNNNN